MIKREKGGVEDEGAAVIKWPRWSHWETALIAF